MNKLVFQVDVPASVKTELVKTFSKEMKSQKKRWKKSHEKEMEYHPGRLSPLNYLVLKVLHDQFGGNSHPAIPIAIGIARKSFSQIKRLLTHGSL